MELDEVFKLIGAYGRYQLLVYFAISLFDNVPSIQHMSIMTFLAYQPDHHCKVPPGASFNATIPQVRDENGRWTPAKCLMYSNVSSSGLHLSHTNITVPCTHGWTYDKEPVLSSIVTEYDLVCDRNVLPEITIMIFNFGVMFGAIVFGFVSDKYGRKVAFLSALMLQVIAGSLCALSPNIALFTFFRFLVGMFEQGVNITGFIMATELFPPKERTVMAMTHEFFWALGGAALPILAYFFRHWYHLQLVVSLQSIFGVALWWLIPESLVWLIAKGRVEEAEDILQRAAKCNGKSLPRHVLSEPPPDVTSSVAKTTLSDAAAADSQKTYTVIDLFRTPNLRKITICICLLWALNTGVYYGLAYNTANLYGDIYLNFFLGQMVELPSVAVTLYAIYRFGRRWPLCLFHVFGGIVCIASPFIPQRTASGVDLTWLSVTLAMLGKFAINSSFCIIYIYGPEIYPTVLRNTGSGLASFSGRIGGIIYPFINYLAKLDTPFAKQLPLVIFGILSIVGGFSALPLPETRHKPLPQTVDDVEHYDEFCKRHAAMTSRKHDDGNDGGAETEMMSMDDAKHS